MSEGKRSQQGGGEQQFFLPSLAMAAHELKSPLSLMRQLALTIADGTVNPAELEEMAQRISLTSERALRLTTDLTRSARLDDGLFALEPVDPLPICHDVVSELRPLYHARGCEITFRQRQRSLPLLVAHRDLLRRILLNFADNALHYAAASQAVELIAEHHRSKQTVRIGIRDYGPGLGSSMRQQLRQSAAPSKLSYRPSSSGLGLYIAQQFADAMHARVGVTQHRDGASFYVDVARSTQLRLL